MISFKWTLAFLLFLGSPVDAGNLLPVAQSHQSAAFVLDGKTARLATGARVEFTYRDENGIPRKVPFVSGFVLGTENDVVFFELSDREAAILARRRAVSEVGYTKVSEPEPEEVAVRREYRDSGHAIRLAPQMRRLTVSMAVDEGIVDGWSPGDTIKFFGARALETSTTINGVRTPTTVYRDVSAMLRSAIKTDDGQYELTVVADPYTARELLRAELEGRLNVERDATPIAEAAVRSRCYVRQRHGSERIEIEIPCRE